MKSRFYHLQINTRTVPFYKDFLTYLDYHLVDEWDSGFGASQDGVTFWVFDTEASHREQTYHRKATGLNHLAFRVEQRSDVDEFVHNFLIPRNITPLYDSPRDFPEYRAGYYAVFFEDPDRIKLEVLYLPIKTTK